MDSIPRENQYKHLLNDIYESDHHYYEIQKDAMIFTGDYDLLWSKLSEKNYIRSYSIEDYLNIKMFCNDQFLSANESFRLSCFNLEKNTKFVKEHFDELLTLINVDLFDYYKINGYNLLDYYLKKWIMNDKEFFIPYIDRFKKKYKYFNKRWLQNENVIKAIGVYSIIKRYLFFYNSGYKYTYIEGGRLMNNFFQYYCLI